MPTLNGNSFDILEENIKNLRQLFPEVECDGKIDFDMLRQILGEYVDDDKERYNFKWNGKGRALRFSQTPSTGTLRPCREESKNWDDTQNLYIEGDNLEVLKILQKSYHGKIKMIYIDPPYNTGKDFVYPDNYHDSIENYKAITGQTDEEGNKISTNTEASGRFHTDWLNMKYRRLRLARNLLTNDGVIFISITDKELDNISKICDEIFGEDNFVGKLILQTATDNNPGQINTEHEYIVCYSKNRSLLPYWYAKSEKAERIQNKYLELKGKHNDDIITIQDELRKWIKSNEKDLSGVTHYDNVDSKGVFHDGDIANTTFGGYEYDVIHPLTRKVCKIPDKGFRFSEETMREMIENDDIMFGADETTLIKPKKRLENAKDVLRSVIYEDGRTSTKKFEQLMSRDVFQNPKSDTVIQRLISMVTNDDDIIMDFFSGSGTTAQSIMQLHSERKFILVQLPENLDKMIDTADSRAKKTLKNAITFLDSIGKPHFITEIGKERIRRAGEKIKEEIESDNVQLKIGEEPKSVPDIGFKVFKLDSSNLKKWNPDFANLEVTLDDMINNYVPDRTEEDIVYEFMLKMGLDLSYPIDVADIDGRKVYSIGFGALMMCLDDNITVSVAEGMVKMYKEQAPETWKVVFRDNGFVDDCTKTNVKLTLVQAGLEEDAFTTV